MLRSFTLFLFVCLLGFSAFAQNRQIGPATQSFVVPGDLPLSPRDAFPDGRFAQDTIFPAIFADTCSDAVFNFTITENWGYLSGTNQFIDLQKAQRLTYTANAPYSITEIWAFFGVVSEVGNGNLRMNIYDIGSGGAPGTLLGTSSDVQVSDIQIDETEALPTIFTYATPVTLSETDFFASVDLEDLYTSNDTVGIFMTDQGCGNGDNTWEEWSDGSWVAYSDPNGWNLDAELLMAAVVEFTPTGVEDPFVETGNLRLYAAQPNPATAQVNLGFSITEASPVTLDIYSAEGRLISSQNLGRLATGYYEENVSVTGLAAGQYVYAIRTDTDRLMSRFVVVK